MNPLQKRLYVIVPSGRKAVSSSRLLCRPIHIARLLSLQRHFVALLSQTKLNKSRFIGQPATFDVRMNAMSG